jgi:hypothetical protein
LTFFNLTQTILITTLHKGQHTFLHVYLAWLAKYSSEQKSLKWKPLGKIIHIFSVSIAYSEETKSSDMPQVFGLFYNAVSTAHCSVNLSLLTGSGAL